MSKVDARIVDGTTRRNTFTRLRQLGNSINGLPFSIQEAKRGDPDEKAVSRDNQTLQKMFAFDSRMGKLQERYLRLSLSRFKQIENRLRNIPKDVLLRYGLGSLANTGKPVGHIERVAATIKSTPMVAGKLSTAPTLDQPPAKRSMSESTILGYLRSVNKPIRATREAQKDSPDDAANQRQDQKRKSLYQRLLLDRLEAIEKRLKGMGGNTRNSLAGLLGGLVSGLGKGAASAGMAVLKALGLLYALKKAKDLGSSLLGRLFGRGRDDDPSRPKQNILKRGLTFLKGRAEMLMATPFVQNILKRLALPALKEVGMKFIGLLRNGLVRLIPAALSGPVGWVAGILLTMKWVWDNLLPDKWKDYIKYKMAQLYLYAVDRLSHAMEWAFDSISRLVDFGVQKFNAVVDRMSTIGVFVAQLITGEGDARLKVKAAFNKMWDDVKDRFGVFMDEFVDLFKRIKDSFIKPFYDELGNFSLMRGLQYFGNTAWDGVSSAAGWVGDKASAAADYVNPMKIQEQAGQYVLNYEARKAQEDAAKAAEAAKQEPQPTVTDQVQTGDTNAVGMILDAVQGTPAPTGGSGAGGGMPTTATQAPNIDPALVGQSGAQLAAMSVQDRYRLKYNNPLLDQYAVAMAAKYGVDPKVVLAVKNAGEKSNTLKANGQFNISPAGAKGVMQFMPGTWTDQTKGTHMNNVYDPMHSIEAGAKYMAQLTKTYGDTDAAIAAYNGGWGPAMRVLQAKEKPLPGWLQKKANAGRTGWMHDETKKYLANTRAYMGGQGANITDSSLMSPMSGAMQQPKSALEQVFGIFASPTTARQVYDATKGAVTPAAKVEREVADLIESKEITRMGMLNRQVPTNDVASPNSLRVKANSDSERIIDRVNLANVPYHENSYPNPGGM